MATSAQIGQAGEAAVVTALKKEGWSITNWNTQVPGSTDIEASSGKKKLLVQVKSAITPDSPASLSSDEERNIKSRAVKWCRRIRGPRNIGSEPGGDQPRLAEAGIICRVRRPSPHNATRERVPIIDFCFRTFAPDRLPVAGIGSHIDGLFDGSGLGCFGMTTSLALGDVAIDQWCERSTRAARVTREICT